MASTPYSTAETADHAVDEREYFPALDGIRAMAFVMVLVFHVSELSAKGSFTGPINYVVLLTRSLWFGVDLFFVLSGFLITGILLGSKHSQNYFRQFYLRRSIRIFPLYYLLLVILFTGLYWSTRDPAQVLGIGRISYWFDLQNIWIAFAKWDKFRFVNHLWSLALEEQFYLIWPAVIFLMPTRRLKLLLGAMLVGPLLLRAVMLFHGGMTGAIYVLLPTRVDSLAAGALMAVIAAEVGGRQRLGKIAPGALLCGLLLMALLFLWRRSYDIGDDPIQLFGYSLDAFVFAAFIATVLFGSTATWLRNLLSRQTMRWIGNRSYAGYLFHWPIALLVHGGVVLITHSVLVDAGITFILTLACTLLAAEISWRWYESFWLRFRRSPAAPSH